MITHVLTNGDAILELEVSDNKDTMTAVFKRSDPDIYDEAEFAVTRNPNYPFELLRDIIDQCGFMDQPYFHADGWKLMTPIPAAPKRPTRPSRPNGKRCSACSGKANASMTSGKSYKLRA